MFRTNHGVIPRHDVRINYSRLMDTSTLAAELCRALRGSRSQIQLARRLGYRSNVPAAWESGRSAPPLRTFLRAAERVGVPVRPGLADFLACTVEEVPPLDTDEGLAALIRRLRGPRTTTELAEESGLSRHALGRWQRGQAEPRLPDLLRVVEAGTGRLLDFVDVFVDPGELPSVVVAWQRLRDGRELLVRSPWVQPVLLALELAAYQALPAHDTGWLARRLDLEEERVEDALARLEQTDQIQWTGTHFRLHRVRTIDTRRDAAGVLAMRAWFAEDALARLRADQADATFSQNLFSISSADLERLRALHVTHFREVQALVAASEPGERLVLLQRSIVPVDRPAPPEDTG